MKDYTEASQKLNGRPSRKLTGNTYLQRRDADTIAVLYHSTDIITFHSDGRTVLQSGGWRTSTTKERMSSYGPVNVSQSKGIWYCSDYRQGAKDGGVTFYADGITFHSDGKVTGQGNDPKAETKLRGQVQKFARKYVEALRAGKIPPPSSGDCWYCSMRETGTRKPLGECFSDRDHILSHLKENYFVPSMLYRALELRASMAERDSVGRIWRALEADDTVTPEIANGWGEFVWDGVRRTLARYLMGQLALAGGIKAA